MSKSVNDVIDKYLRISHTARQEWCHSKQQVGSYNAICEALHSADIEELLCVGAPDDEYNLEAGIITYVLNEKSTESLPEIVSKVFNRMFSSNYTEYDDAIIEAVDLIESNPSYKTVLQ
jgi:hypothetical protein